MLDEQERQGTCNET